MQIWKMNEDDVPLKKCSVDFLRLNRQNHFQGVKTVHLEIFPTHELGDDHAKPSHHPPVVQLDGMIF